MVRDGPGEGKVATASFWDGYRAGDGFGVLLSWRLERQLYGGVCVLL